VDLITARSQLPLWPLFKIKILNSTASILLKVIKESKKASVFGLKLFLKYCCNQIKWVRWKQHNTNYDQKAWNIIGILSLLTLFVQCSLPLDKLLICIGLKFQVIISGCSQVTSDSMSLLEKILLFQIKSGITFPLTVSYLYWQWNNWLTCAILYWKMLSRNEDDQED